MKNHILDVHLQPELLDIKQEPDMDDDIEEGDLLSPENDDNEGNKKNVRRKRNVRKSAKKAAFINKHIEDDDSFGTHFLEGYGKQASNCYENILIPRIPDRRRVF